MKPKKTDWEKLREQLANIEHQRWSGWHKWCRSRWTKEAVKRWDKQAETPYLLLSEKEKDSDRREVDKYLPLIKSFLFQELKREREDSYKKGYFKGVLDSEYGQVTSDELLPNNLPKGAIIENVAKKPLKGKSHKK